MLDGLEVKEKLFSDVIKNKDFRYDSQFYTKEPIKNNALKYDKINNILIKAQYGISIAMNENNVGYPIYRMNEIHNMMCDLDVSKYADITKTELETFVLNDKDVVFNRTNSFEWVGRTGLYRKLDKNNFVFASYLVRFIPNENIILPEYLTTFLNSKYGQWDIKRRARQSINQTNVNPEEVKAMDIPILNMNIQNNIRDLFETSHNNRVTSDSLYKKAEQLLLKELDLLDFEPSKEKIAIKTLSETFGDSGRLDSEYYQPKYDDIIDKIKSYRGGYESINIACKFKNTNYKPADKKLYQYVELSNIGTTGDITGFTYEQGQDLPSRARRLIKENDVIISSIEGSLEKIAIVRKEFDDSLCSTGFYVVDSKKINSETLLVLFKNQIMQQILKQNCSGTILTGMNKDEFLNIIIPLINITIQTQIEEKIKESFKLKEESKQLLDVAKRAVEIAIEDGEDFATKFINEKIEV